MLSDLTYAFRQFLKSPGFTFTSLLTLALGIGSFTAIFSVVNRVLLRPLSYAESDQLVQFWESKLPQFPQFSVAPGQYFTWREQAKSFEQTAAQRFDAFTLTGQGQAQRLISQAVTASYFPTLRIQPALGRGFSEIENTPGHEKEVILTHAFWLRQFGGNAEIINQSIQLSGEPYQVVGIMPAQFQTDWSAEMLTPLVFSPADHQQRSSHFLKVLGRLRHGVTREQAQMEVRVIASQLELQYPETNRGWTVDLTSMLDGIVAPVRPMLFTLLGAVSFLLVIGCVNVANLQLARATTRSKEMAVRVAQGATRGRIIRQLLTESAVLASIGGIFGVLIAPWGIELLLALAPGGLPRDNEIQIDSTALGVALGLILVTCLASGLAPALQASRVSLNHALKESSRGTSAGVRQQRLLSIFVVIELAMALAILVASGLLVRSFIRLQNVSPGFNAEHAVAMELNLPYKKYLTTRQQNDFAERVIAELIRLPGVESVGAVQTMPFSGADEYYAFRMEGSASARESDWPSTTFYSVTPEYFKAMGISLRRGRLFDAKDKADAPEVAIINESMAKHYFPNGDALGKKILLTTGKRNWQEIVGIVSDTKLARLDRNVLWQAYQPFAQRSNAYQTYVIRTADNRSLSLNSVRAVIDAVDSEQPITHFKSLDDLVASSMVQQRYSMQLFSAFSAAALLLAITGIYGVMAYAVTRRTGEIGIRMALGAQRQDILRLILVQGSRLVSLGIIGGIALSLVLTRFLASLLYSTSTYDPITYLLTLLILALVAAAASLIPAYRATKISPLVALQSE